MGVCSKKCFMLTICILQIITMVERQVFDFLGYMWVPILVNLFNIIFVILGFFGIYQCQFKYILMYTIWNVLWVFWNIFLICFYLNIGSLDKHSNILNFGTGSYSWWQEKGPGCKALYDTTEPEMFRLSRPANVTGCLVDYEVVEIIHSSTQCIFAVIAVIGGTCLVKMSLNKEHHPNVRARNTLPRPLYSIEYSQPDVEVQEEGLSPKPMTPRRVKRRSVISRDGTKRSSRRSSVRQSRRKNTLNRMSCPPESLYANTQPPSFMNQVTTLSPSALSYDRISNVLNGERNPNLHMEGPNTVVSSPNLWNKDFEYANSSTIFSVNSGNWNNGSSSTRNLAENWQTNNSSHWQGQSNPTFQQSSTQSLHGEDLEDLYSNRPASARSSYSNYHGVRATPQVPNRTDVVRQSQRQFMLSGGPPAYQDTVI